jgi:hypothetical protein
MVVADRCLRDDLLVEASNVVLVLDGAESVSSFLYFIASNFAAPDHCGTGCTAGFGRCGAGPSPAPSPPSSVSTNGRCGADGNNVRI